MSKSYGNVIPLFEDDKAIKKAIFSIKTDSRPMEEPKDPEEILVYEIYKSIATPEQLQEMGDGLRQGKLGYGHIKICCWTPSLTKLKKPEKNTTIIWQISVKSKKC